MSVAKALEESFEKLDTSEASENEVIVEDPTVTSSFDQKPINIDDDLDSDGLIVAEPPSGFKDPEVEDEYPISPAKPRIERVDSTSSSDSKSSKEKPIQPVRRIVPGSTTSKLDTKNEHSDSGTELSTSPPPKEEVDSKVDIVPYQESSESGVILRAEDGSEDSEQESSSIESQKPITYLTGDMQFSIKSYDDRKVEQSYETKLIRSESIKNDKLLESTQDVVVSVDEPRHQSIVFDSSSAKATAPASPSPKPEVCIT